MSFDSFFVSRVQVWLVYRNFDAVKYSRLYHWHFPLLENLLAMYHNIGKVKDQPPLACTESSVGWHINNSHDRMFSSSHSIEEVLRCYRKTKTWTVIQCPLQLEVEKGIISMFMNGTLSDIELEKGVNSAVHLRSRNKSGAFEMLTLDYSTTILLILQPMMKKALREGSVSLEMYLNGFVWP